MCGSVRLEGKNSNNVWWNDVIKDAVETKEVLVVRDGVAKERYKKNLQRRKEKV